MSSIKDRFESVQERIDLAARRSGRSPEDIRIMAVSKLHPREKVQEAYEAGVRLFGENRVQEAEEKYADFHEDAELHLIGHLQSNKAKHVVGLVKCVQSIDKLKTANELEKRCSAAQEHMDIYLEFNTSGEASKSGYQAKDDMFADIDKMAELEHLSIRGLMTIGPLTEDEQRVREAFVQLRQLFDETAGRYPHLPLNVLSMGMTSDFEIAVEEGSTMVRIGSALFGPRE
jgi:hypothetical protein